MGFCSTFVTEWGGAAVFPDWFVEKWQRSVHFGEGNSLPLSSRVSAKAHGYWATLEEDIQKAYPWAGGASVSEIVLVYLHECGGITRAEISRDGIRYHDPVGWRKTHGNIAHDWGDGCSSEIENAQDELDEHPAV